jgi:hypothetical protein
MVSPGAADLMFLFDVLPLNKHYCGMLSGKQGVDAMTIENPNVKGIWTTIEVDERGFQ